MWTRERARWPSPAGLDARTTRLLDGDRLREVARLVDVETVEAGDVVGEQLQRDDREDRLQEPIGARDEDRLVGRLGDPS